MRKLSMCIVSAFLATVITGCSSIVRPFSDAGYVEIHGDEKGIRSWFDGTNGLIQTGKNENVHELDNHHKLRGEQEKTARHGLTVALGKGEKNE